MSEQRLKSSLFNMVGVLFLITLISGFILALVYQKTFPIIQATLDKEKKMAIMQVLPLTQGQLLLGDKIIVELKKGESYECYPAFNDNHLGSFAIQSYSKKGYNGKIELMISYLKNGSIHRVKVLSQLETPGLGAKINSEQFLSQFISIKPDQLKMQVKKDGGVVDAITAATISSRAVCDAIERSFQVFSKCREVIK